MLNDSVNHNCQRVTVKEETWNTWEIKEKISFLNVLRKPVISRVKITLMEHKELKRALSKHIILGFGRRQGDFSISAIINERDVFIFNYQLKDKYKFTAMTLPPS